MQLIGSIAIVIILMLPLLRGFSYAASRLQESRGKSRYKEILFWIAALLIAFGLRSRSHPASSADDVSSERSQSSKHSHLLPSVSPPAEIVGKPEPMPAGAKGSGSGQAVVQDPVRYLLGEDPFPKLNAYKRYVDKYLQGPEDYELRHLKFVRDTILDLPFYRLKTKITDLDKGAVIFIPKRSADEMVSEVHEGTIVYQDLHIYKSILDPSLKADLPVCILYFAEYTGQGRTANGTVLLNFSKVSHPIELPRGFRGVHIENYERFSVWLKAMDCGFISESEELDDRYRSLQLIHILFTVPTMNSVKE